MNNKADKSTVTTLQTTVSGIQSQVAQKCEISMGHFIGDGKYPRTVSIGFRPKIVLIITREGTTWNSGYAYGGLFSAELPIYSNEKIAAVITDSGFTLMNQHLNMSGRDYYYLCFK